MTHAYYNEFDKNAAAWLRELIRAGLIAPGDVDERSIEDVTPNDLAGYTQCHFFAGIGGWSLALRRAGWPDDRPVWTGSCPCQPFSAAGKRGGTSDERHLWPAFFELIRACQPPVVFGEQVASSQVVGKQAKGARVPGGVSAAAPGEGLDPARQGACGQAELGLRLGLRLGLGSVDSRNSSADRRWLLRSDGSAFPADGWADVGQPVDRPTEASGGLYLPEHSRGLPRSEQRDGRLGRAEAGRDGGWHPEETESRIRRLVEEIGRTPDGEDEPAWIDVVFSDLERAGYTCGSAVLPACGVGAPHIRQRLWFVGVADAAISGSLPGPLGGVHRSQEGAGARDAEPERSRSVGGLEHSTGDGRLEGRAGANGRGAASGRGLGGMADRDDAGLEGWGQPGRERAAERAAGPGGVAGRLADALRGGAGDRPGQGLGAQATSDGSDGRLPGQRLRIGVEGAPCDTQRPGPVNGFWRDADWLLCRDGKWRPVEPGTFPLAHGVSGRVGLLRGYGNAISPEAAQAFIKAATEALDYHPETA